MAGKEDAMHDIDRIPSPGAPPRRPWERRSPPKRHTDEASTSQEAVADPTEPEDHDASESSERTARVDIRI